VSSARRSSPHRDDAHEHEKARAARQDAADGATGAADDVRVGAGEERLEDV